MKTSRTASSWNRPAGKRDGRWCRQIAGLIARRIVCWVKEGQSLAAGEQIGLIRFGSQVNLMMPKSVQVKVKAGDRVEAGAPSLRRRFVDVKRGIYIFPAC